MIIKARPLTDRAYEAPTVDLVEAYMLPPRTIYHYTSVDTAKEIIAKQTLRFSHPDTFNDPLDLYDGLIDYQGTEQQIIGWVNKLGQSNEFCQQLIGNILADPIEAERKVFRKSINQTKADIGICCFSRVPDQVLMWSHYADKHKGVCLGFSIQPSQAISESEDFFVYRVNYPNQVKAVSYFDNTDEVIKHWVFTKAPCWAYEQEIRAVINGMHAMPDAPDVHFEKACLTEVYYGCRTTPSQRESLDQLLKINSFNLERKCLMQIDDDTFSVKEISLG